MDCFHWENRSRAGGDFFFSVETSTAPGYFLPEEIAAGRTHVEDLVFCFSIPRSPAPAKVFAAMSRAVQYARSRLGGAIVDNSGMPADFDQQLREIQEVEHQLRRAGFEPGKDATLRLF
jgi:cell division protein ZipA